MKGEKNNFLFNIKMLVPLLAIVVSIGGLGHYTRLEYKRIKNNIHAQISDESTQETSEPPKPSDFDWFADDEDYWDDYHSPIADGWRDGCWGIGK